MKHLIGYLKYYKKECFLAPLFKMLEASFELFVPLVVAQMVDNGISKGDRSYIVKCCLLLFILAAIGLVSAVTAQYFAAKAAVGFATGLRSDLFSHLMSLSFKEYDEIGSSTMITRMTSDVMQCQTGINWFLRLALRSPFVVFGAMIMAFTIDVKAALVFVVVIAVLSAVVAVIMKINIPLLVNAQTKLDRVTRHTRENLVGARILRAFSRENVEKEDNDRITDELYTGQIIAARVSAFMNPVTYVIINLAIVCLIYVGAIRVETGILTQGSVIALYNYMSQILVELIKLANVIVTLNKALASADRLSKVLQIDNSQKFDSDYAATLNQWTDSVVEFDNVSFKYHKNGDEALSGISFSAHSGEVIGIVGGTGSGKSTLVNLIPRFYDASAGKVMINGQDVTDVDPAILREHIGFVFQKASLFSGTIADNLRFGNETATDGEMEKAMELAVATDVIQAKGGITAQVGEAGKELSGGQRQRITIARALIRKPDILIFDDSTSALDFATQARFLDNMRKLDYSPIIFIVSQRTNAMINADKIIVLEDGNIAGMGTHKELLENCTLYSEIHNSQFVTVSKEVENHE